MSERSFKEYELLESGVNNLKALHERGLISDSDYTSGIQELGVTYNNGGMTQDACATIVQNYSSITAGAAGQHVTVVSTSATGADSSSATEATTSAAGDVVNNGTVTADSAKGASYQSVYDTAWDPEIDNYIGNYSGKGGRLSQFVHNDGKDDDARIAYLKLSGGTDNIAAMASISSFYASDKSKLDAIYKLLSASNKKYDRFIMTGLGENRSEKISTMKTVGDSFNVTFSGREPLVINVSGSLIFDYDRDRMSWYTAFCNAYEYYLRASVTSRYRVKVRLVLPDFTVYEGYIISLGSSQSSDSDMFVPFNFSMVITQEYMNQAYNEDLTAVTDGTVASEYEQAKKNAANEASATGSVSPETDGAVAKAENGVKAAGGEVTTNGSTTTSTTSGGSGAVESRVNNSTAKDAVKKEKLSDQIFAAKNYANKVYTAVTQVANACGARFNKNSIFR